MVSFIKVFAGLLLAFIVITSSSFFSLDMSNIRTLDMSEEQLHAVESHLRFSENVVRVFERAGSDPVLSGYLLACPGSTALLLAEEAYKTSVRGFSLDHRVGAIGWSGEECLPPRVDQDVVAVWRNVTGGFLDFFTEEALRQSVEWIEIGEELGEEESNYFPHRAAAKVLARLLGFLTQVKLRYTLAMHRIWGVPVIPSESLIIRQEADTGATTAILLLNVGSSKDDPERREYNVSSARKSPSQDGGPPHGASEKEAASCMMMCRTWWECLRAKVEEVEYQGTMEKDGSSGGEGREKLFAEEEEVMMGEGGEEVAWKGEFERTPHQEGDEISAQIIKRDDVEEHAVSIRPRKRQWKGNQYRWWEPRCRMELWQDSRPETAAKRVNINNQRERVFNDADDWILLVG